mmetsp:Transcript_58855/g.131643  ORF Transcript_58855/g.131643 Transcript_58855/m.131643 type:complete len:107 (-) Transcript_58855:122-442(-)
MDGTSRKTTEVVPAKRRLWEGGQLLALAVVLLGPSYSASLFEAVRAASRRLVPYAIIPSSGIAGNYASTTSRPTGHFHKAHVTASRTHMQLMLGRLYASKWRGPRR